jgi:hypothetical protein
MQPGQPNVVSFPLPSRQRFMDEGARSVIATLEAQLALARDGKLRSIALASVSADGAAIRTGCSCDHEDVPSLAEVLALLALDIARP